MHKSDMKSNPNDRGKGPGGQSKDENRNHQGQDMKQGQPAKPRQPTKQGQQKGQPDVENPNAHRAGASGVMRGPAGNNKPEKGVEHDDQDDRNELDDEDVDTANSSKQKRNEKRHSM